MQDLLSFLTNHPFLSLGACITFILVTIVELLRARKGIYAINPQELTQLINHENAVVIDLRPSNEFKQGHIINAQNFSHSEILQTPKKLEKYRTKPVVFVGNSGTEAQKTAAILLKQGYNSYSLTGGIKMWIDAQLPLIKD